MLSQRNQFPRRAGRIDRLIRDTFQRRIAVLAFDMYGFTRLTAEYGITHYLAMIARMEEAATPPVMENGGRVAKQSADDLFAIFPTPADALEAALGIFRAFDVINRAVPPQRGIRGSIGIGYGDTLVIDDADLFGEEMNYACKLGEDLAGPREILLTRAAHEALPPGRYLCRPVRFTISDVVLDAYRFQGKLVAGEP
jgi:class 3 adenylate cyclase